jgi:hypothetical protein
VRTSSVNVLLINSQEPRSGSVHAAGDVSPRLACVCQRRVDEPRLALGHFDQLGTEAGDSIRVILHDELAIALVDFLDACVRRHAKDVPPGSVTGPERRLVLSGALPARRFLFGGLALPRGSFFGSPSACGVAGGSFLKARPAPSIDCHIGNAAESTD